MRKQADKSRMWVSWKKHNELMVLNKQRWGPGVDFWILRPQETLATGSRYGPPVWILIKTCLSKVIFQTIRIF